jgi:hypothetical protein
LIGLDKKKENVLNSKRIKIILLKGNLAEVLEVLQQGITIRLKQEK